MKLSVVMAVYNGAAALPATLESILAQTERDFELIVVDDGSTDATPEILREAALRDDRIRVITQQNTGLTRALIRGCAEARGEMIARHDCDDRSAPERFARELALIEQGATVASCATRYVDADGDLLFIARANGVDVQRSLLHDDASRLYGMPSHGATMFRRDAYERCGGYREQFRVAQDIDLWIRLAGDGGPIAITDEVLYETTVDPRGISGNARAAQVRLLEIAIALRDGKGSLDDAAHVRVAPRTRRGEAAALYFVGKCLLQQKNRKGMSMLREVVRRDPLHWRAWLSLLAHGMRRR